jgi:hypothetical protein
MSTADRPFASQDTLVRYAIEKLDPRKVELARDGSVILRDTGIGLDTRSRAHRARDRKRAQS